MKLKKIIYVCLFVVSTGIVAHACRKVTQRCVSDGINPSKEAIIIEYTNPGPNLFLTLNLDKVFNGGVFIDVVDSSGNTVAKNLKCLKRIGKVSYICQVSSEILNALSLESPIQISGFTGQNTVYPKKVILNLKNAEGAPLLSDAENQVVSYVPFCGIPNIKTRNIQPITDGIADCAALFTQSSTQGGTTLDPSWNLAGMVMHQNGLGVYQIWARTDLGDSQNTLNEAGKHYVLISDYVVPNINSFEGANFCQANGIIENANLANSRLEFAPVAGTSQMLTDFFHNVIQNEQFGCNASQYVIPMGIKGYAQSTLNMCQNLNVNKEARGYPLFQNVAWSLANYDNIVGNWYTWAAHFIPVSKNVRIWSESISSTTPNYTYAYSGNSQLLWPLDVILGEAVRCVGVAKFKDTKQCN